MTVERRGSWLAGAAVIVGLWLTSLAHTPRRVEPFVGSYAQVSASPTPARLVDGGVAYLVAEGGDVNGDGVVDGRDVLYLVNAVYAGGPQPPRHRVGRLDVQHNGVWVGAWTPDANGVVRDATGQAVQFELSDPLGRMPSETVTLVSR